MTSAQIRQSFLAFFREKNHTIVSSASLLPESPNLLFTNAGMNQFVPIFLGQRAPDLDQWRGALKGSKTRAADTQKCIRAGGKHNDLDDVGLDTYHHTFFEMLGNWSFGDYFKKEAIAWAWELLVERWGFPPGRIYATVYCPHMDLARWHRELDACIRTVRHGAMVEWLDDAPGAGEIERSDRESAERWAELFIKADLNPADHIVPGSKKDNFWMMGDTGPCGPCSELHIDLTPAGDTRGSLVNTGDPRCIEIWNLVFIQFNANSGGAFTPLPARHVDTGMGFERVTSIIQGTKNFTDFASARISNYDTDIFRPIFDELEKMSGLRYASTLPATDQKEPNASRGELTEKVASNLAQNIQSGDSDLNNPSQGTSNPSQEESNLSQGKSDPREGSSNPRGGTGRASWGRGNPGSALVPSAGEGVSRSRTSPDVLSDTDASGSQHALGSSSLRDAATSTRDARAPQNAAAPAQTQIALDIAFRVIADHIRTLSFAIADGVQPSNEGRGYVLRRILRRAVRYGRTLDLHEPFFHKLASVLALTTGDTFPELRAKQTHIEEVLRREEEAFNKTLDRGIMLFEQQARWLDRIKGTAEEEQIDYDVPADLAFGLYDTYGFPLDLTELMARERGLTVDTAGFEKLMEEQRTRARGAQKKQVIELSEIETKEPTHFLGYEQDETAAEVADVLATKGRIAVVLNTTTCYAEMGGQVGDTGELTRGAETWRIANTQKSGATWLHFLAPDQPAAPIPNSEFRIPNSSHSSPPPAPGDHVTLTLDRPRRRAIERHHTVTHLLHWALHQVVSREAAQKGSFVGPDKLTFDFNSAALTPAQVRDVEKLVNERIVENAAVSWIEVPFAEIKGRDDVMQFFGDKYGDRVRVVQIGGAPRALDGYSMELCAGTHTRATGEIGLFKIVSETAIAAGVRRIEAIAGLHAYDLAHADSDRLKALAQKLGSPLPELEKKLDALRAQQKDLERALESLRKKQAAATAQSLLAKAAPINGTPAIIEQIPAATGDELQSIADALKAANFRGVVVLAGVRQDSSLPKVVSEDSSLPSGEARSQPPSVALIATVSPEFTSKFQAGKIIQTIAPLVGGKGGGRPDSARGAGKDAGKIADALTRARALLE